MIDFCPFPLNWKQQIFESGSCRRRHGLEPLSWIIGQRACPVPRSVGYCNVVPCWSIHWTGLLPSSRLGLKFGRGQGQGKSKGRGLGWTLRQNLARESGLGALNTEAGHQKKHSAFLLADDIAATLTGL